MTKGGIVGTSKIRCRYLLCDTLQARAFRFREIVMAVERCAILRISETHTHTHTLTLGCLHIPASALIIVVTPAKWWFRIRIRRTLKQLHQQQYNR